MAEPPVWSRLRVDADWRSLWETGEIVRQMKRWQARALNPNVSDEERREAVNRLAGMEAVRDTVDQMANEGLRREHEAAAIALAEEERKERRRADRFAVIPRLTG